MGWQSIIWLLFERVSLIVERLWGWWPVFPFIKCPQPPSKFALPPLVSLLLHLKSWPRHQVAPCWAISWTWHWNSTIQQLMRLASFLLESTHHQISAPGLHPAVIHLVTLARSPFMITEGSDLVFCLTGQQWVRNAMWIALSRKLLGSQRVPCSQMNVMSD